MPSFHRPIPELGAGGSPGAPVIRRRRARVLVGGMMASRCRRRIRRHVHAGQLHQRRGAQGSAGVRREVGRLQDSNKATTAGRAVRVGQEVGDGVPDNYFLVTNALKLGDQLSAAFLGNHQAHTASSASVNTGSCDTRVYQAKFSSGDEVSGEFSRYARCCRPNGMQRGMMATGTTAAFSSPPMQIPTTGWHSVGVRSAHAPGPAAAGALGWPGSESPQLCAR